MESINYLTQTKSKIQKAHHNHSKNKRIDRHYISKLKIRLFNLIHTGLTYHKTSIISLWCINSLELCQLLYYSFNPIFQSTWEIRRFTNLYTIFYKFFSLTIFTTYIMNISITYLLIIFVLICTWIIIITLLFIYWYLNIYNISTMSVTPIYLFNLIAIMFNRILLIPLLIPLVSFFNCQRMLVHFEYDTNNDMDKDVICTYWITKVASYVIFGFIVLIGFTLSVLYFDMKPMYINTSKKTKIKSDPNYMASISNWYHVFLFFNKIIIVMFFENLDKYFGDLDNNTHLILSSYLFLASFIYFLIIHKTQIFVSEKTRIIYCIISSIWFITNLIILSSKFLLRFGISDIHCFIEVWIWLLILVILFEWFNSRHEENELFLCGDIRNITPSKAIKRINYFLDLIADIGFANSRVKLLLGLIIDHCDVCTDTDCGLNKIQKEFNLKDKSKLNVTQLYNSAMIDKYWVDYINDSFISYIRLFPNYANLRICYAMFWLMKLNNIALSKVQMHIAYIYRPGFIEQFSLYRWNRWTKIHFLQQEENQNVDIMSTIIFNQLYKHFQETLRKIGIWYIDFWTMFIHDDLNINKVKEVGFTILNLIEQVFQWWTQMEQINPKHKESLFWFGEFLLKIINDNSLGQELWNKSKQSPVGSSLIELSEDGSPVIIASIEKNNVILITHITNSFTRLSGYMKIDLIGKDINVLLPQQWRSLHQECVDRYLKKNIDVKYTEPRKVQGTALHKDGYLYQIKGCIVWLPNFSGELKIAMSIQKYKKREFEYNGLIWVKDNLEICNLSTECIRIWDLCDKGWRMIRSNRFKDLIDLRKLISGWNNVKMLEKDVFIQDIQVYSYKKIYGKCKAKKERNNGISLSRSNTLTSWKKTNSKRKHNNGMTFSNENHKLHFINQIAKSWALKEKNEMNKSNILGNKCDWLIKQVKFKLLTSNYFILKIIQKISPYQLLKHQMSSFFAKTPNQSKPPTPKNKSSILYSSQLLTKQQYPKSCLDCFKFYTARKVFFDEEKSDFIISSLNPNINKNHLYSSDIIITSQEQSELKNPLFLNEKDLNGEYHLVLNFRNYSENVLFHNLEPVSWTINPIPQMIKPRLCYEWINFFDEDTWKINDYLNNVDEDSLQYNQDNNLNNNNQVNKNALDKTKYEINKQQIFSTLNISKQPTNVYRIKNVALLGLLSHWICASATFVWYSKYLGNTEIYTEGWNKVGSLLNYTVTSSSFLLDSLLWSSRGIFTDDFTIYYDTIVNSHLSSNYKAMHELSSIADVENIWSKIFSAINNLEIFKNWTNSPDSPMELQVSHWLFFDQKTNNLTLNTEEVTFNEATIRVISSISSITKVYNYQVSLFTNDAFFLCFNSINEYYSKTITLMNTITLWISELTPHDWIIVVYITLFLCTVLFFGWFFWLRQPQKKSNLIIEQIVNIQIKELQYIVKLAERFVKNIRVNTSVSEQNISNNNNHSINNNKSNKDNSSNSQDRDNEFEGMINNRNSNQTKKATSNQQKEKLRITWKDDLILIITLSVIFVIMLMYYVIQYLYWIDFNTNLDQFVLWYSTSYFYISSINLLSIGVKLSWYFSITGWDPKELKFSMLNNDWNLMIKERFSLLLDEKHSLNKELITSLFLSSNFTGYYNEHIMSDSLYDNDYWNISNSFNLIQDLQPLTFDVVHSYYYNLLSEYFFKGLNKDLIISEGNYIKDSIWTPFITNLWNCLFVDLNYLKKGRNDLVKLWFASFFVIVIVWYVGMWWPIENNIDNDVSFNLIKWF